MAERGQALRRGTTAVALPFFDDFTLPLEGTPRVQNWEPTGGALVTNRLAIFPLTRGAATLDGLRADGQSYSGAITGSYGTLDSLKSQAINLGGLTPNDAVYLSFAWQAGSIVSTPNLDINNIRVRLGLYVKTVANNWELVWEKRSTKVTTPFRQEVIDLNQAKFLHGDFQFMFVATGNRSDNSDNWSVDYVVLDRGRTRGLADTTFVDIATSAGIRGGIPSGSLRSPLRRFSAMPVWQFNAATPANSELSAQLSATITNLNAGLLPVPISLLGTVRERPNGPVLGTWLQRNKAFPVNPRLDSVIGHPNRVPIPGSAAPKTLRYTLALNTQETNPRTLPNDTIFRDVELRDYYAYDDGTAENITQLTPYTTGQASAFAYRFDLNQPDFVRALRLYPAFTASDRASRSVTVSVWGRDNATGQPIATPLASKTAVIPNPLPAGWEYFEVTFDQPVRVTGSFFVGYAGRDDQHGGNEHGHGPQCRGIFAVPQSCAGHGYHLRARLCPRHLARCCGPQRVAAACCTGRSGHTCTTIFASRCVHSAAHARRWQHHWPPAYAGMRLRCS
jgi:hypothetical protein